MKKILFMLTAALFISNIAFAWPSAEDRAFKKLPENLQKELLEECEEVRKNCKGGCFYMIEATKNLIKKKTEEKEKIEKEELAPIDAALEEIFNAPYTEETMDKVRALHEERFKVRSKILVPTKEIKKLEAFLEVIDIDAWINGSKEEKEETALIMQQKIDFESGLSNVFNAMFPKV